MTKNVWTHAIRPGSPTLTTSATATRVAPPRPRCVVGRARARVIGRGSAIWAIEPFHQQYRANETANPWKASASILSPLGPGSRQERVDRACPVTLLGRASAAWSRNRPPATVAATRARRPGTASSTASTDLAASGTASPRRVSDDPVPATTTSVEPEAPLGRGHDASRRPSIHRAEAPVAARPRGRRGRRRPRSRPPDGPASAAGEPSRCSPIPRRRIVARVPVAHRRARDRARRSRRGRRGSTGLASSRSSASVAMTAAGLGPARADDVARRRCERTCR